MNLLNVIFYANELICMGADIGEVMYCDVHAHVLKLILEQFLLCRTRVGVWVGFILDAFTYAVLCL